MKRWIALALLSLGVVGRTVAGNVVPPPGFTALFNGRDLEGWWGCGTEDPRSWMSLPPDQLRRRQEQSLEDLRAHWRVEDGELVNDGKGLYATTLRNFRDFELLLEYKTVPKADSGVYLKGIPQVQIWDTTAEGGKWHLGADKGSGGLWNNPPGSPGRDPLVHADRPFGEWNHLRILQCGARTWVWLNGQLVVSNATLENYFARSTGYESPDPAVPRQPVPPEGPIQLQTHGGEIRWRNIFIREIPGEEANRILRGQDPEGFRPIFNGRDFTGWTGATGDFEVVDGAIVCRPGRGGTIWTTEIFTNFVVRLEFKLPRGGNNGLAIRYPGHGAPHLDGMCEVQVLDDQYEKVRGPIDPRQVHGSAYGMVAAARGYQRPIGEWNYQEVTVSGTTVRVELNGNVILNADLSKVTQTMHNTPHPGATRLFGHFGFCGHNDPVAFRNISIASLP